MRASSSAKRSSGDALLGADSVVGFAADVAALARGGADSVGKAASASASRAAGAGETRARAAAAWPDIEVEWGAAGMVGALARPATWAPVAKSAPATIPPAPHLTSA